MKKRVFVLIALLIVILTAIGGITMFPLFSSKSEVQNTSETFHWVPEESYFVDYEVTDKNTVKFRYSICFVNNSEEDTTICVSAKFKNKELNGWVEPEIFAGNDENGNMIYQKINTGERMNVVFVFEGKYLGGPVNGNLSFPDELILMQS